MQHDEHYMRKCLELSQKGMGYVAPNPMVGAVIVYQDRIIGSGYHEAFGQAHAEVNAVNAVEDARLLPESTIYVSLEPCAHHGKTPPCADLLVEKRFKRVVMGCTDSFSRVSGKGIERLQAAGIETTVGVLEKECRALNRRFFTFHEKKRPYVVLKWAQTRNGLLDKSDGAEGEVTWISGKETQKMVHKWRSEEQAILVGKNTILADDPSLTVRVVEGKNPTRIILDTTAELNYNHSVFDDSAHTFRFNTRKSFKEGSNEDVLLSEMSIERILEQLYELDIQSVLVEGGARTLSSFLAAGIWDEARVITGQQEWESGTSAPSLNRKAIRRESCGPDQIAYYENHD